MYHTRELDYREIQTEDTMSTATANPEVCATWSAIRELAKADTREVIARIGQGMRPTEPELDRVYELLTLVHRLVVDTEQHGQSVPAFSTRAFQ